MQEKESLSKGAKYLIPCWAQSAAKLQEQLLEGLWAGSEGRGWGAAAGGAPGVTQQQNGGTRAQGHPSTENPGLCEHKGGLIPPEVRLRVPQPARHRAVWAAPVAAQELHRCPQICPSCSQPSSGLSLSPCPSDTRPRLLQSSVPVPRGELQLFFQKWGLQQLHTWQVHTEFAEPRARFSFTKSFGFLWSLRSVELSLFQVLKQTLNQPLFSAK